MGLSVNAPQSEVWINKDPNCFVFGFEPVKSNREKIIRGNSPWPINLNPKRIGKSINILPCALLDKPNEKGLEIFVTKNDPGCSSVLKPKNFEIDYIEKTPVYTLNDFLNFFPFERLKYISHLKTDVQGADIQVLEGSNLYLNRIMAITLEVDTSGYESSRNSFKSIQNLLKQFGFIHIKKGFKGRLQQIVLGFKISCETDDPSFINLPLYRKFTPKNFWIYQRG